MMMIAFVLSGTLKLMNAILNEAHVTSLNPKKKY